MPSNRHVRSREERPLKLRFAHAQAHDRELRGGDAIRTPNEQRLARRPDPRRWPPR